MRTVRALPMAAIVTGGIVAPGSVAAPAHAGGVESPIVSVDVVACDDGNDFGGNRGDGLQPASGGPTKLYQVTTFLHHENLEVAD